MNFWQKILKYKLISTTFLVSGLLVLGAWLWAILALSGINQPLIFHFSSYAGINEIGNLGNFANIAVFSLLTVGLNFTLAFALVERDWFWGKLLAAGTLVYALLTFIGFAAIISVN